MACPDPEPEGLGYHTHEDVVRRQAPGLARQGMEGLPARLIVGDAFGHARGSRGGVQQEEFVRSHRGEGRGGQVPDARLYAVDPHDFIAHQFPADLDVVAQGKPALRRRGHEILHRQSVVDRATDQRPGSAEPQQVLDFPAPGPGTDAHGHEAGFFAAHQGHVDAGPVREQDGHPIAPGQAEFAAEQVAETLPGGVVALPGQGLARPPVGDIIRPAAREFGDALGKGLGHGCVSHGAGSGPG